MREEASPTSASKRFTSRNRPQKTKTVLALIRDEIRMETMRCPVHQGPRAGGVSQRFLKKRSSLDVHTCRSPRPLSYVENWVLMNNYVFLLEKATSWSKYSLLASTNLRKDLSEKPARD
jgi:hypothetical protein